MRVLEPTTFFILLVTSFILSASNYFAFGFLNIKTFYFVFLVIIHIFLIIFLGYYSTLLINKYSKSKFHNKPQIFYGNKSVEKYVKKHNWIMIIPFLELSGGRLLKYPFGKIEKEIKKSAIDIYKTTIFIFILSIIFILLLNKIQLKPITLFTIVFTLLIELGIEIRLKQEFIKKRFNV